jgi:hypothetical protein
VCRGNDRGQVEQLLGMLVPATDVARRVGGVSPESCRRHWRHLPPARKAAIQGAAVFGRSDVDALDKLAELRESERSNLIARLAILRGRLNKLSLDDEDRRTSVAACAQLIRHAELTARILGELRTDPSVVNNSLTVVGSQGDMAQLRSIIETALAPHPTARAALLSALAQRAAIEKKS